MDEAPAQVRLSLKGFLARPRGAVADVVTGKPDVRAAAASLPARAEADPADALVDDDDLDEAADAFEDEEVAA